MRRLSSRSIKYSANIGLLVIAVAVIGFAQNSPHGPLKQPCTDCHTTESWKVLAVPMKFNHSTTGFSLQGVHSNTPCVQCHTTKRFAGTSADCYSCHQRDFTKAMSPNHQVGKLSHDCVSCHTFNSWQPSVFQHSKTNFQLMGAHLSVECASCHTNDRFNGLPGDCFSCHQKDYLAARNPNHGTAQFSHDCLSCHTLNGWHPSTFNHSKTNFVLAGIHVTLECSSCHINGRFKGIAADCFTCHQKDFTAAVNPNHVSAQFDHNCVACHTTNSWSPSTFDHAKTEFQLTGAHSLVECFQCHTNGVFKGTSRECYPCHQSELLKIVMPNHIQGQFSHDCLTCHTNIGWKPSTFDHNKTNFQLLGAHVAADCATCHANNQFKGLPSDCYSCHQQEFAKVTAPNHVTGQFSHDCITCHSNIVWKPSTFNHSATGFPLLGAHVSLECGSCHLNGQFKGIPADCFSCHQNDFNAAANPNHLTSQFSHDCVLCHSTAAWKPATFNHASTNFPLVGAHAAVACLDCHKNGQYIGLSTDCFTCHQTDFNAVIDPNHGANNFDHNCLTCHSMNGWSPAAFDHNKTMFPLTGAHSSVPCANCHVGGKYAGTSTDCFACHQSDYNATINPAHAAANYPTACLSCHTTTVWKPSTFNHTPFFPIGSGDKHRPGRWNSCADCHTNVSNFKVFSCIDCHEHNKTSMDKEHQGRTGYVYDSNACYKCHPTGRG